MFYIIDNLPNKPATNFFFDRYLRIAPMYYLATLVFVVFGFTQITSHHQIIQTITFLKYYETAPLLSIGWTLEYEFIFYSLCAFAMLLFRTFTSRLYFVVISLSLAVFVIDFYFFAEKKIRTFSEFAFGIMIYILFK